MPKITFDFEIALLTLRVTSNDQDNRRNRYFIENHTKRGITHVPSFIISKLYFQSLDFEIHLLTLKMTFNHQNSTRNSLFNQSDTKRGQHHKKKTYYTSSYFSFLKLMFLHFDLGIDLTTLRMILNPQNNTINGFSDQIPIKKRYYTS